VSDHESRPPAAPHGSTYGEDVPAESPPDGQRRPRRGVWVVFLLFVIASTAAALVARNLDDGEEEQLGARLGGGGETPSMEVAEAVSVTRVPDASSLCAQDLDAEIERQIGRLPAASVASLQPADVQRALARAVVLSGRSTFAVFAVPLGGTGAARELVDEYRESAEGYHRDTPVREASSFVGGSSEGGSRPIREVTACSTVTILFGDDQEDRLLYAIGVAPSEGGAADFCDKFDLSYLCDEASSDGVPEGERGISPGEAGD